MSANQAITIRFELVADPTVFVDIRTTVGRRREKIRACRRDIVHGRFPRWLPFQGRPYRHRFLDWSVETDLPEHYQDLEDIEAETAEMNRQRSA